MTRYEERSPSRRAWLTLLGACAVVWLALLVLDPGFVLEASIIVAILGGVGAVTMWSTGRYGNIRLTDSELRVGRASIPLTELHPWGVTEPGREVHGKLVGGAYGSTLGSQVVGLTRRDGTHVLVRSTAPDALRAALEAALTPYRAGG
ncbi:DUF3093 family protein [Cellulomonas soli]|uniref:DUF3093 domain-containing protein n=1 Tax=Cellulomonas soli TaxID=931535 RepID=A0A512P9N4_9CELL|nr:DUF3093 family protein [Cellulomonas soli]NYI60387.1 hypothetical protein [Cellulomonas soli]GEP67900.1 hypothetical protein CSO01_06150 [Cellulomonas soli]